MSDASPTGRSQLYPRALVTYVYALAVLAVLLAASIFLNQPQVPLFPEQVQPALSARFLVSLTIAGLVLHVLNQLDFTIRFSDQPDNVELTFSEAGLVATFFLFPPGYVVILSGIVHLVRELQAHRRSYVKVLFNVSEIMVSVALAGWVFQTICVAFGTEHVVVAMVAAMLTHSVANRLLVGTVMSLNAGGFQAKYYRSLFVENVVMLFANLALGMTVVLALIVNPALLWVPFAILGVVYVSYQAYVGQLRDANTLARLYQNAQLGNIDSEPSLIRTALLKALDTFGSLEVSFTMVASPDRLERWRLEKDTETPSVTQEPGLLRGLEGAEKPLLLVEEIGQHAKAWRAGAHITGMAAPVQYEGQLMGVLRASKPRAWDSFTQGDLRAFSLFAQQFGASLENVRLHEIDREQQRLRQQVLDAERNRISRDLHDSFVQTLVQVDLHLSYLLRLSEIRPADVPGELASLREDVLSGLADARRYMAELKPLRVAPGQFVPLAARYLDEFGRQHRLATVFEGEWSGEEEIDPEALTDLFQILREGLNNVAKHAKARTVELRLDSDPNHVVLSLRDDGVGFDPGRAEEYRRDGHFGLSNICERATGLNGAVEWDSAPGCGTTLTVTVPRLSTVESAKGEAS